jgi:chaperonin GroES
MAGEVVPMQQPAQTPEMPPAIEKLKALAELPNIAADMADAELAEIGDLAIREYNIDLDSMETWKGRMERGLKLASMEKDEKTYPWKDASNVRYPLVTTAVLMFNAKAYPAVVSGDQVVKAAVYGADPDGAKAARADRVAAHMSWQLTSKVIEWEEETDKLLTLLPLVGTLHRKTWYDVAWKRIRCRNILPANFVINNRVTSLQDAPRCTEVMSKYPAEIQERRRSGEWRDVDYIEDKGDDTSPPQDFIEQHRRMDLDKDGYDEPYIVTVHVDTQKVARIVADFTGEDITLDGEGKVSSIKRGEYFTAFHFMPSMDGSYFSTGFGLLLGDISETINSIINMMLDAGHMASLGGGFIGSDFRIKGGSQRFKPGEWKMAQVTGGVIKDSLVPLTFPGADKTLFEMLGLLIEAGKEVASVKDVLQGDTGGKTQTATTTLALIEQGMASFTAAYKRIFRSLKQEYALIARINRDTVTPEEYNRFHDEMEPAPTPEMAPAQMPPGMPQQGGPLGPPMPPMGAPGQPPQEGMAPGADPAMMGHNGGPPMQPKVYDPRAEYDLTDMDIVPVADPQSVTRMQQAAKAQVVMEMAMADPPLVDRAEAAKRTLEAAGIADADALAPKPDPMGEQMSQLTMRLQAAEAGLKEAQAMLAQAQTQKTMTEAPAAPPPDTSPIEFEKIASAERQTAAKLQADAEVKAAEAEKKRVEAQAILDELRLKEAELAIKGHDLRLREKEVGIAERGAAREDFTAKAAVEHKGQEIGLSAKKAEDDTELARHGAALAEWQAEAGVSQKDTELGIKDRESRKKTFAPAKKAKPEPEPEAKPAKPRKTVTRVTKHDDKGRIIEFVQEDE